MASGGHPPYYGQPPFSQPSQAYSNYSTTNQQRFYQDHPSSSSQRQSFTQSYEQTPQYGSAQNWYGLNSSEANVGRAAAETLSNLGNSIRHNTSGSPAAATQQLAPGLYGSAYSYPSSSGPSQTSTQPSMYRHGGTNTTDSLREDARVSTASPQTHHSAPSAGQHRSRHRQHGSIGPPPRISSPAGQQSAPGYPAGAGWMTSGVDHQRQTSAGQAQYAGQQAGISPAPPITRVNSAVPAQRATPEQGPTYTVDPAEVYDPWPEYQRRKAFEDAQKMKKQADEASRIRALEALEKQGADDQRQTDAQRSTEPVSALSRTDSHPEQPGLATKAGAASKSNGTTAKAKKLKGLGKSASRGAEVGSPAQSRKKVTPKPAEDDEDAQLLSMLKSMKAKDPERFKRLMAADSVESAEAVASDAQMKAPLPAKSLGLGLSPTTVPLNVAAPPPTSISTSVVAGIGASVPGEAEKPTIWPPEKKRQLATAAAKYLNQYPGNQNTQVQPEVIINILDQNPSYLLLCQQLEARGIQIDRAVFARTLLQAVPDVNNAAKKQRSERDKELRQLNGQTIDLTCHEEGAAPPHVKQTVDAIVQGSTPAISKWTVEEHVSTSTKEQAARKRTFDDLVDLTALSDDAPEPEPKRVQSNHAMYDSNCGSAGPERYGFAHPPVQDVYQTTPASWHDFKPGQYSLRQPLVPPVPPRSEIQDAALPDKLRNASVVNNIGRKKARRRVSYDPRTIARDVLLATGRHPDMHHLNAHLEGLRQRFPFVTEKADLETLRWDLIDPGIPLPLPQLEEDNDSVIVDPEGSEAEGEARDTKLEAAKYVSIPKRRGQPPPSAHPLEDTGRDAFHGTSANAITLPNLQERFAYRGFHAINQPSQTAKPRAEGGRKTLADRSSEAAAPSSPIVRQSSTKPSPQHQKDGKLSGTMSGTGYSAFNQLNPDGTKKRGRPVGWRKAVHMDPSKLTMADRSKAAMKSKLREASEAESEPHHQVYGCKYNGCTSQLHNLKTLRAHVNKVHGQEHSDQRSYVCLWDDCGREEDVDFSKQRIYFRTQPEWWTHLEDMHFNPLAWKLGDGPRSGLSDVNDSEQFELYLKDAEGKQVTPRIKTPPLAMSAYDQSLPHDSHALDHGRGRGRPPIPRATLERKALDAEERLRNKKRALGIGLDKGGVTLANDERRKGFIDDEDFELVIDDDVAS